VNSTFMVLVAEVPGGASNKTNPGGLNV